MANQNVLGELISAISFADDKPMDTECKCAHSLRIRGIGTY